MTNRVWSVPGSMCFFRFADRGRICAWSDEHRQSQLIGCHSGLDPGPPSKLGRLLFGWDVSFTSCKTCSLHPAQKQSVELASSASFQKSNRSRSRDQGICNDLYGFLASCRHMTDILLGPWFEHPYALFIHLISLQMGPRRRNVFGFISKYDPSWAPNHIDETARWPIKSPEIETWKLDTRLPRIEDMGTVRQTKSGTAPAPLPVKRRYHDHV